MDELLECMEGKLAWLESLDLGVIGLMAPLAGISSEQLLSDIIVAGHVAASFFNFRVLYKAREPPWVWATGDHEWKMKILLEQDPPTEPVSLNITYWQRRNGPHLRYMVVLMVFLSFLGQFRLLNNPTKPLLALPSCMTGRKLHKSLPEPW